MRRYSDDQRTVLLQLLTKAQGTWGNQLLSLHGPEGHVAQFSGDSPVRGKVGVEGREPGNGSPIPLGPGEGFGVESIMGNLS